MSISDEPSPRRIAAVIFIVLLAPTFFGAVLYRNWWLLPFIAEVIAWFIALLLAAFHVGFALKDAHPSWAARLKAASLIPIAILSVLLLHVGIGLGPRVEASLYLAAHSDAMQEAQRAAGPNQAAAMTFYEGIPDGGAAIIRSQVRPDKLSKREQSRLTGEDIQGCRRIVPDAWLCGYD